MGRFRNKNVLPDNHRRNILNEFTNSSKTGFSLERFTAGFLQFTSATVKNWLLGGPLGTCHLFQAFQGFSLNFLISEDPLSYIVRQLARQFVNSPFGDNILRLQIFCARFRQQTSDTS